MLLLLQQFQLGLLLLRHLLMMQQLLLQLLFLLLALLLVLLLLLLQPVACPAWRGRRCHLQLCEWHSFRDRGQLVVLAVGSSCTVGISLQVGGVLGIQRY